MARSKKESDQSKRRRPPAKSLEAREQQLVASAVDLAEKKILDGTASSQIIVHYLKLGSTSEKLNQEILKKQKELLTAKTDSIKAEAESKELYQQALDAMRKYSGRGESSYEDD